MTLPQLSLIIVGAPITIIQFLKVGYGDNYNTKMRPLAVNVTEIHCQTIFLLTIGALAPLTAAPLQSSTHNHFEKITPLITGTPFRTSSDKLKRDLGWTSLSDRRKLHKLTLYHKLRHDARTPEYITNTLPRTRYDDTGRTLENSTLHTLPQNRTTSFQRSFVPSTIRLWNNLPENIRILTQHNQFKRAVFKQMGPSRPPKYYELGTKIGNILHTKLRLGISDLNSHLFEIQKSDTTACRCGHTQENVQHFICQCPNYREKRLTLYQNISKIINTSFKDLSQSD